MSISAVPGTMTALPPPSKEEMAAIIAARPAVLQAQQVALQATGAGTSGQGTPQVDTSGGVDLYA